MIQMWWFFPQIFQFRWWPSQCFPCELGHRSRSVARLPWRRRVARISRVRDRKNAVIIELSICIYVYKYVTYIYIYAQTSLNFLYLLWLFDFLCFSDISSTLAKNAAGVSLPHRSIARSQFPRDAARFWWTVGPRGAAKILWNSMAILWSGKGFSC